MALTEQIHKNLYRSYFRGHLWDYDKSLANFQNMSFYTTNPVYALFYAGKSGIVSEYMLKREANIFNARSKTDFYTLHKYVNDNSLSISYDEVSAMKDDDWLCVLKGNKNINKILNAIEKLGYDGFFNFEYTKKFKEFLDSELIPA